MSERSLLLTASPGGRPTAEGCRRPRQGRGRPALFQGYGQGLRHRRARDRGAGRRALRVGQGEPGPGRCHRPVRHPLLGARARVEGVGALVLAGSRSEYPPSFPASQGWLAADLLDNWASVDVFCADAMGAFLAAPRLRREIKTWALHPTAGSSGLRPSRSSSWRNGGVPGRDLQGRGLSFPVDDDLIQRPPAGCSARRASATRSGSGPSFSSMGGPSPDDTAVRDRALPGGRAEGPSRPDQIGWNLSPVPPYYGMDRSRAACAINLPSHHESERSPGSRARPGPSSIAETESCVPLSKGDQVKTRRLIVLGSCLLVLAALSFAPTEGRLLRFPAVSRDQIVFSLRRRPVHRSPDTAGSPASSRATRATRPSPGFRRTARPSPSPANMTATAKSS